MRLPATDGAVLAVDLGRVRRGGESAVYGAVGPSGPLLVQVVLRSASAPRRAPWR